jgi:hypothetical protein
LADFWICPGWLLDSQINLSFGLQQVVLGISKSCDTYSSALLVHGLRAAIRVAENKVEHDKLAQEIDGKTQQELGSSGPGQ